ncbi:hypothetical protein [Haladaptatus sp. CMAA 1911]|uniref:hypothetical protein n=1 Tax=unclassified Haladaptatus TaxID=2622732 RepID=UPI0037544F9C
METNWVPPPPEPLEFFDPPDFAGPPEHPATIVAVVIPTLDARNVRLSMPRL